MKDLYLTFDTYIDNKQWLSSKYLFCIIYCFEVPCKALFILHCIHVVMSCSAWICCLCTHQLLHWDLRYYSKVKFLTWLWSSVHCIELWYIPIMQVHCSGAWLKLDPYWLSLSLVQCVSFKKNTDYRFGNRENVYPIQQVISTDLDKSLQHKFVMCLGAKLLPEVHINIAQFIMSCVFYQYR